MGFIGAGNYASQILIPAFKAAGARLKSVASSTGVSGLHAARKYGFEETTTDTESLLADPEINIVVVATRHDSHARYVCEALQAGKHVFVEKLLALTRVELQARVILYGSKAKGADNAESDIDLLVLTSKELTWQECSAITDALFDVQLAHNVVITPLVVSDREWSQGRYAVLPIHDEVERHGVAA